MTLSVSPTRATANTSKATPAVTVMAPGTSSCPLLLGGSGGSSRNEAISSATPTGAFTKKTRRHVTSASRPPSTAPGSKSRRDDRAVDAQGVAAFLLAGIAGDQQGQARGRQHGRPDALHHPGGDQQARLDGQTPGDARHHEHDQADPVQPGPAVHVGQPAAQQQEPPEGDRIAADQPLQRGRGDVQAVLDRGQGDVDDREVQHDHELRHRQGEQQREPRTGCARRGLAQADHPARRRRG